MMYILFNIELEMADRDRVEKCSEYYTTKYYTTKYYTTEYPLMRTYKITPKMTGLLIAQPSFRAFIETQPHTRSDNTHKNVDATPAEKTSKAVRCDDAPYSIQDSVTLRKALVGSV